MAGTIKLHITSQTNQIREAARAFVEKPSAETESKLNESIAAYREPKIDQLSLRGVQPEPAAEIPPTATVPAVIGPPSPKYLVEALQRARNMGAQTSAYRKAIEQLSTESVRRIFERLGVDTQDRGNDFAGYDVEVTTRTPDSKKLFVEIKATSDPNGIVTFTPAEINFFRNHKENNDAVLSIVVIDKDGGTKVYFRRGIDLGNPLPPGAGKRPFLIHDLLSMGAEVNPQSPFQEPPKALPAPEK